MAEGFVHTLYRDGKWLNEIEGTQAMSTFDTKEEAVDAGRDEAQRGLTEHVIHNEDGTISERNSYGNDPAFRSG